MNASINGALPPPKQIRFVNNEGHPPSKRRRINAACLTCRRRKTRCSGEPGTCTTCTKNGHECLGYNDIVDRKKAFAGPRKPTHVSGNDDSLVKRERDLGSGSSSSEHAVEERDRRCLDETTGGPYEHAEHKCSPRRSSISSHGTAKSCLKRSHSNDWDHGMPPPHQQQQNRSDRTRNSRTVSFSEDRHGSPDHSPVRHRNEASRVPYFRYFGRTAIVPGFKQMLVSISYRDKRRRGSSYSANSPKSSAENRALSGTSNEPVVFEDQDEKPGYDLSDSAPPYEPSDNEPTDPLIISLIETFFVHLGCNYPFLRREKFIRMVKEKKVEPILVDVMCALATRFSDLPVRPHARDRRDWAEIGNAFAQRAKAATVDAYPCPTVGAVQAYLLLAYECFGQDQDSALWMYLGNAIRMADDLGLHREVGVKYQGEKDPWYTRTWSIKSSGADRSEDKTGDDDDTLSPEEQSEVEQERVDTFWAVFVLDRVISSGTGRPVRYKDGDFELPLPEPAVDPATGLPDPFPFFIRIIHLYGRASDVLNSITDPKDLTTDKFSRVKSDLTQLYEEQDPRLHFNAVNFQEYVKAGQGTTFILLHFWFHALIIVMHAPNVLFFGLVSPIQLLPDSRHLSMSSAKTIADILSFAEIIDPKSFIGNPFTSQPMYIAACAFLMQSGAQPSEPSPPDDDTSLENGEARSSKHSLLALGANQNYQMVKKSLQQLQLYWGGVKYILTALDQKSKGIWDCETYTLEEYAAATRIARRGSLAPLRRVEISSPSAAPIAYATLTGTTNSPNTNLTRFYQSSSSANPHTNAPSQAPPLLTPPPQNHHQGSSGSSSGPASASTPPGNMIYDPIRQSLPEPPPMFAPVYPQPCLSAVRFLQTPPEQQQPRSQQSNMSLHRQSASLVASGAHRQQLAEKSQSGFDTTGLGGGTSVEDDSVDGSPASGSAGAEGKVHVLGGMTHPGVGTPHHHGASQPPVVSYTPSSQSSSTYEQSAMQASPSGSLVDTAPSQQQHQQQHQHQHQDQQHHTLQHGPTSAADGGGGFSSPFPHSADFASLNQYPHLTDLPFDSQEITLELSEIVPPWLMVDCLPPHELLGLFDDHVRAEAARLSAGDSRRP